MNERIEPDNCFRRAVHYGYGYPLAELPELSPVGNADAFWLAWREWAATRDQWWYESKELAPISADRWIATVYSPWADERHALVMSRDRLLFDPNSVAGPSQRGFVTPDQLHRDLSPDWIISAFALVPGWRDEIPGPFVQIAGEAAIEETKAQAIA
jgi:hypothetical protein